MSAISRFTVRSLSQNKVRTVVTILGVALAAALLTAVMTSFSSLTNYLSEEERLTSGTWTAQIETGGAGELPVSEAIQTAQNSSEVKSWATVSDAGFAQDPNEPTSGYGHDLCLKTVDGDYQTTCAVTPSEGTLPTSETEIMLPWTWKNTKGFAVGNTVTLNVGERRVMEVPVDPEMPLPDNDVPYAVGDYLNSNDPLVDYAALGMQETLADTHPVTYTITGFYNDFNTGLMTGWGVPAGVVGASSLVLHKPTTSLYLDIPEVKTLTELTGIVHELYPQPDIEPVYHTALLRYNFVDTGGSIWDMFEGIVILLAIIIAIACISLIYNAFAISVAERSRQFGLLASIGASKRQLRFSIWLEALIIAALGIPLGIAIGLAGCAITFACIGPMIEQAISGMNALSYPFTVHVDVLFLVVVALLSLLVVLISVWIPALRASRVTAIEALRNVENVRIAPRTYKELEKKGASTSTWKKLGIAGRVFGIGGQIGSINHKRSAAKGRAASFSLALAVVLLMTAGMVNSYFDSIINTADRTNDYDISVSYGFEGIYKDETSAQAYQLLADFSDKVRSTVEGVEGASEDGWMYYADVSLKIPQNMLGQTTLERGNNNFEPLGYVLGDGTYAAQGTLTYLPREAFDEFCRANSIDPSLVQQTPGSSQAIMVANQQMTTSSAYVIAQTISRTGTLDVVTGATINGKEASGITLQIDGAVASEPDASGVYAHLDWGTYAPYVQTDDGVIEDADATDDVALITRPVEIVGLAHTVVSPLSLSTPYSIVMPFEEDALIPCPLGSLDYMNFVAGYNATDHVSAADEIDNRVSLLQKQLKEQHDPLMADLTFYSINDYTAQQESTKALILVINVFCLLFTVILMLIALANVFNTITNGLILRRREFAVMKSIGMSDKQFNRMIASECVGYGVRGFIPGIIIAAGLCWVFSVVVTQAMQGIGYLFPWTYLWLALGLVALALIISVFFGLRKAKSGNVVEALRDDAL